MAPLPEPLQSSRVGQDPELHLKREDAGTLRVSLQEVWERSTDAQHRKSPHAEGP